MRGRATGRRGEDGEGELGLGERSGENADAVEARAGGDDAVSGDEAAGGLDADDSVEGGGDPARAGGVRAEREVGDAEGDGDGGSGAGSAGDPRRVVGAAYRAVRGAGADEAGGELIHVGTAEHDGTGGSEPRDGGGVGGRVVGVGRAGGGGGEAVDVDVALDGHGAAGEGSCSPASTRASMARASDSVSARGRRVIQMSGR